MLGFRLQDHLEKLIHFESAARLGKISAAAQSIRSSPAAISRSIKILEENLGERLIIRRQNGIELTEEGQTLFEFSKKIIYDTCEIEKSIRRISTPNEVHLRVGTHETLAIYFWPEALKAFFRDYPNIRISLTSGRVEHLVQGLQNRHFDLIVSVEPLPTAGVETERLYRTKLQLYAGAPNQYKTTYPQLSASTVSLSVINQVPLLTDIKANPRQGQSMKQFLVDQGFDLKNIFELNSFEAAIRLAQKGLGIAILPEPTAIEPLKSKRLRKIRIQGISQEHFGEHTVSISLLSANKTNAAITALMKHLKA